MSGTRRRRGSREGESDSDREAVRFDAHLLIEVVPVLDPVVVVEELAARRVSDPALPALDHLRVVRGQPLGWQHIAQSFSHDHLRAGPRRRTRQQPGAGGGRLPKRAVSKQTQT